MENNKLIAEFMDLPKYGKSEYLSIYNGIYSLDDLRYHKSWDWIMPVVEKIESFKNKIHSLDFQITIERTALLINATPLYITIHQFNNITKIESIYLACIEFIKWYNINFKNI